MFLYIITNLLNGKEYIGVSKRPKYRFTDHARSKTAIGNAIRKYGKENFKLRILVEGNDIYITDLEPRCILAYGTLAPGGYNTSLQTQTSFKHHEMSKEKMRKPKSDAARENMSKAKKGKPNGRKGIFKHTLESKQKIRTIQKVITPEGEFLGIGEAAKFYGIGEGAVYQRCSKKLKSFQNWEVIKEI
jgi:group I intron endonuclease